MITEPAARMITTSATHHHHQPSPPSSVPSSTQPPPLSANSAAAAATRFNTTITCASSRNTYVQRVFAKLRHAVPFPCLLSCLVTNNRSKYIARFSQSAAIEDEVACGSRNRFLKGCTRCLALCSLSVASSNQQVFLYSPVESGQVESGVTFSSPI